MRSWPSSRPLRSSKRSRGSAIADRRLDVDREIALEQLPRRIRPAFGALWHLDLAFADVVSTSSDARLGAIRLAWWREQLLDLDRGLTAPAEPRLQAVANELLSTGIKGEQLSLLEDAWLPALEPFPWNVVQSEGFRLRGRILFEIGAVLLGAEPSAATAPGELWSLLDAAQHCSDKQSRDHLLNAARSLSLSSKVPKKLRPLTVTAAIAVTNAFGPVSGMKRGLTAASHRFVGRFPDLPRR